MSTGSHWQKHCNPPQNNPDYVKRPLESMTSLHCLVAMVTLNSCWQRKSGTCAQVFFLSSSSHHQSRRLFLTSLLFVSARVPSFFPSLFSLSSPHSLIPSCLTDSAPKKQQKSAQKQRQKGKKLLCHPAQTTICRQAGWVDGLGGGQRRVLGVIVSMHDSKQLKSPCAMLRGQRGLSEEESRTGICPWSAREHIYEKYYYPFLFHSASS